MVLLKTVISGQWSVVRKVSTIMALILVAHCSLFIAEVKAEEKAYKINIEGMHCNMCVYRVTKSLKKLKEVREVEVDLDEGIATVTLNDGADVATVALNEAVKDSGYKPNGVEIVGANGHSPDKDGEGRK
ncbi:MAG: heavy metal-associated domain-containing protein [Deltaproteobacteria bacterium]|nr:heavy metal-associated domain-containing protein [Deltaproteobacteria bacterium]